LNRSNPSPVEKDMAVLLGLCRIYWSWHNLILAQSWNPIVGIMFCFVNERFAGPFKLFVLDLGLNLRPGD